MRLEQVGTEFWAEIDADGVAQAGNWPEGTVGYAYDNPMGDLSGFFGEDQIGLAEDIANEDSGLIIWLA
jgi:hypothetical protein